MSRSEGAGRFLLFTVIDEDIAQRPSSPIALAQTKTFNVQLSTADTDDEQAGQLWEGGWWRIQAPGQSFAHYGGGTLITETGLRAGSVSATLQSESGQSPKRVIVHGTWRCSHVSQAG